MAKKAGARRRRASPGARTPLTVVALQSYVRARECDEKGGESALESPAPIGTLRAHGEFLPTPRDRGPASHRRGFRPSQRLRRSHRSRERMARSPSGAGEAMSCDGVGDDRRLL
jgi:hypothetical protein